MSSPSFLRCAGVDPHRHELKGELDRLGTYMTKISAAQAKLSGVTGPMPSALGNSRLDKGAASRFVRSALNDAGTLARSLARLCRAVKRVRTLCATRWIIADLLKIPEE